MAKTKKEKPAKPAGDDAAKKGGIKGMIGGLLAPLVLGGAAFGTVYMLPSTGPEVKSSHHDEKSADENLSADSYFKAKEKTAIVPLKEITLSLSNSQSILRINIALEAPYNKASDINPEDLRLRDAYMGYLRSLKEEQLDNSGFMPQLREQLLRRSKLILGNDTVSSILITDFLIR